ncbi:Chemotaxis protein CheD [Thermogutta terrifontis]|uniref:Probable chemoreceptor glutamine deamidase CheD n=1 Tax=Thermogutta terrifontis TaxID=1331910 RepID=A0A286RLQ7_9BACT|nr:chemotaxis protein CheD [Thermogutta terrifontis]ASV76881.1 Chemotaxis protein CheD [Thermogutta terrifontis]
MHSLANPGTIPVKGQAINVGMGQIATGDRATQFTSVLGSCVAVVLWHPRLSLAAIAHVVLPKSHGQNGQPGKFADTAIPYMLEQLARMGCPKPGLVAKIAGGANMFRVGGPLQIGDDNVATIREILKMAGIPITAEDVGGTHGRKITFTCSTGEMLIEIAGEKAKVI